MFAQLIRGRPTDLVALSRQFQRWHEDLAPSVQGWFGTTAGHADQGDFVAIVRFESEDSARANAARAEQSDWWAQTSSALVDTTFSDYPEVDLYLAGEAEGAGFVQVFTGRATDLERFRALGQALAPKFLPFRPEETGDTVAWRSNGEFAFTGYYTSLEDARTGETREVPAALQAEWDAWHALGEDLVYFDLADPWIWVRDQMTHVVDRHVHGPSGR